jgi:RHS repeat-associated protein
MYDAETGLVRFGARDYDARLGRWIAKDPVRWGGRDVNLYAYVGSDPINFVDPLGWMKLPPDPSGLGPEWTPVPTRNPNGKMFQHPSGDALEFEKGRPGLPGWRGRDHWHRYPQGKKEKGKHYRPGDEIPDPAAMCGAGSPLEWEPDSHSSFDDYIDMLESGWIPFLPFGVRIPVPQLEPFLVPAEI